MGPPHLPLQAPRERCPRVNDRPPPTTAHRGEAFARGFPACPLPVRPPCSLLYKMNAVKCLCTVMYNLRVYLMLSGPVPVYTCDRLCSVSVVWLLLVHGYWLK